MSNRERITNKGMRNALHRDEVAEFIRRGSEWAKAHLDNVIIGAVVLIIISFVIPFYLSNRTGRMEKASMVISEAHRLYQQAVGSDPAKGGKEGLTQAAAKYQEIVTAYSGSPAEAEAVLGLANCDWAQGKTEGAEAAYQEFIKKYPSHPLAPLALAGVASCQESKKNFSLAAQTLISIQQKYPGAANKNISLLDAARNWVLAGEKSKAKGLLEGMLTDKDIPEGMLAQARARLKAL